MPVSEVGRPPSNTVSRAFQTAPGRASCGGEFTDQASAGPLDSETGRPVSMRPSATIVSASASTMSRISRRRIHANRRRARLVREDETCSSERRAARYARARARAALTRAV